MSARIFQSLKGISKISALTFGAVAMANAQTFTYDGNSRVSRAIYQNGAALNFTYDAMGNVLSATGTAGPFAASVLVTATTPVASGQGVAITASVAGASPSGSVQFRDSSSPLGGPVALVSGVSQLVQGGLTPGVHQITAAYSGDAANLPATSAAFGVTVTGVTVNVSHTSTGTGQQTTLTATITGASPTGTVQFKVNGVNVASPVAVVNGIATLTIPGLDTRGATISAVYSGDSNNSPLTSDPVVDASPGSSSGDVPLPPWALWLLGGGLIAMFTRSIKTRVAR
jgi:hypothetical protein